MSSGEGKKKYVGFSALMDAERARPASPKPTPTDSVAPTESVEAPHHVAPPENVAATENVPEPLHVVAATLDVAPTIIAHPEQYHSMPNELSDAILPTLKPIEQVVLIRLYRLTRGFRRDTCKVSIAKLASACNTGTTQTRLAAQALERRGLIRRINVDMSNPNQAARGIEFEMVLPGVATTKSVAPTKSVGATKRGAATESVAMKETTQKENTQTQAGASGSRFSLEECRRYADHLHKTGQGIERPGGYATSIYRTGEADKLIEAFYNPARQVDITQCPDCRGSNFVHVDPADMDKGVKPCKHERLGNGLSGESI